MGCGCGMTAGVDPRWSRRGVWQKIHEELLAKLNGADQIDWSRASVDSRTIRALGGGERPDLAPFKTQTRQQAARIVDGQGTPWLRL